MGEGRIYKCMNQRINIDLTKVFEDNFWMKDTLNPMIWDGDKLDKIVRKDLLDIAKDFWADTGMEMPVDDIVFTGSMANYTYNDHSDIDVHIVVDFSREKNPELSQKYLDMYRWRWNKFHNIRIHSYDVELYVQDVSQGSSGVYSLLEDDWVQKPKQTDVDVDPELVEKKALDKEAEIDNLIDELDSGEELNKTYSRLATLLAKIVKTRRAAISAEGEFSVENLVFKRLRSDGYMEKLTDATNAAYDMQHSI
jgi:hypothetical protein